VISIKAIQRGSWRRGKDGKYKPFIQGCAQLNGTIVEVISRDGRSTYVEISGTYERITGGYLYEFRYIRRPKSCTEISNCNYDINISKTNKKPEEGLISMEDLEKALGLNT
jgi:hypothetical protein